VRENSRVDQLIDNGAARRYSTLVKIDSATYRTGAQTLDECPPSRLPEFAFVGRSNVGKSSLINLLTGRKELAKTSSKAGRTRLINFFDINEAWTLVDLPGYGYARVSRTQQHEFNINVSAYLTQRENLKHVFALVDSGLEPQESDLAFIEWLHQQGVPFSVVFTKIDKTSEGAVKDVSQQFLEQLKAMGVEPSGSFSCSAKTSRGKGPILQFIESQLPKKKKTAGTRISLDWMKKPKKRS
jgi:GTP-binding protein